MQLTTGATRRPADHDGVDPAGAARGRDVAVVGAGITGLAAARRLAAAGAQVTVYESAPTVGGQLSSVELAGQRVDVGAESVFTAAPGPLELIEELGLSQRLIAANEATTWIWTHRGLKPLPEGFTPAGPSRLGPVLASGVLSPAGMLRAGLEPLVPARRDDGDLAVGTYLDRRFGREVTDRLVDPLLGGLHSGDVRRLSLRSATPQLAALAARHRSLLLRRRGPARSGPAFVTLADGMAALPRHLAASLGDVEVVTGTRVSHLRRRGARTELATDDGRVLGFDAVVLALPARAAARLVAEASPYARVVLDGLRAASVAVTVLAYPAAAATTPAIAAGSGLLVPSRSRRLLKAATFLSTKWPHHVATDRVLVRASAGRADDARVQLLDDAQLVERLHTDLAEATGLDHDPLGSVVQRWPSTMPQLEVGHADRVAEVTRALAADLPGVALAGSAYLGPGLSACLRSAEQAAAGVLDRLQERHA